MGLLDGKVAIVTGAGGGIGREDAILFAREGAKVVVNDPGCDRDGSGGGTRAEEVAAFIRDNGGQAVADLNAVGSFAAAEKIVATAVRSFGRLDVLVNNAGILRDRTLLKMTEQEWDDVQNVHLKGTFACSQAAARVMKDQPTGGRIINTTSVSGMLGIFGQSNYSSAKAGIYALTRVAATELKRYNINVNAIAPVAMTRMMQDLDGVKETLTAEVMGPRHVAPLALYLASEASAGITGQTFAIEGNHLFAYRVMNTHGAKKHGDNEPWTADEIAKAVNQVLYW